MTGLGPPRHELQDLQRFANELLGAAGLDSDKAQTVARLLVMADAMGHTTHGLAQLAAYLDEIESGAMETLGGPTIVSDPRRRGGLGRAATAWPVAGGAGGGAGVRSRGDDTGVCAISIRRSHHSGCLAALLPAATERGLMAIVSCSDPSSAMVAPFGGRGAVFTPDPIAVGIPTDGDPILIDMSASITTAGMSARLRQEGRRYHGAWAIDAQGRASDHPALLVADPPGALLPAGGLDHGQKGYGLALMVEALTQGLSGHGRADGETGWGASVFVQAFDPALFGGAEAFARQTGFIAELCRASPPIDPARPVRLPGEAALRGLREAETLGVALYPGTLDGLAPARARYGVAGPATA